MTGRTVRLRDSFFVMIWLICTQALVGMLLVVAVLRPRNSVRRLVSEETALARRAKIHVVSSNRAGAGLREAAISGGNDGLPGPLAWVGAGIAGCVLFLMRQFAIRILGAQWRPRQD